MQGNSFFAVILMIAQMIQEQNRAEEEARLKEMEALRAKNLAEFEAAQQRQADYETRTQKAWVTQQNQKLDMAEKLADKLVQSSDVQQEVREALVTYRAQVAKLAGAAAFDPGAELTPEMKALDEIRAKPRADVTEKVATLGQVLGVMDAQRLELYGPQDERVKWAQQQLQKITDELNPPKAGAATAEDEKQQKKAARTQRAMTAAAQIDEEKAPFQEPKQGVHGQSGTGTPGKSPQADKDSGPDF